jgi:tRNA dimethylallyltransferase
VTLRILAIFGPTASGKSSLAMARAAERPSEIVACDAVMVYRGFDIGANKPTRAEQAEVPHHLIDVCEATDAMNAARYAELAGKVISDIVARGAQPIVVVGTFLYYRALVYGLGALPPSQPALRAELLGQEAREPGFLAREVARIDPASFAEAHGKNLPRLARALEVFRLTGERASSLRAAHGFAEARYEVERVGIDPPRELLDARITARVNDMWQRGMLDEVRALRTKIPHDAMAMRALGYAQVNDALDAGEMDAAKVCGAIALATRQYARKQRSFMRKEEGVEWRR